MSYQCPICLRDRCSDEIHITSCGHIFCKKCIGKALERSTQCPVCRAIVVDKINPYCSLLEINMDEDLLKDADKRVAWIQKMCRKHQSHKKSKFETVCQQMIMQKESSKLLSQKERNQAVFLKLSPDAFKSMDKFTRFVRAKIFTGDIADCSWKSEKNCSYIECRFTRVVFTGVMVNSLFVNCTFSDCAFMKCSFIGDKCGFSGCTFERGTRVIDCETETPLSWKKIMMNEKEFARIMELRGLPV